MIETARWSDNRLRNRPINPKEKARIAFAMRAFEFGGESGRGDRSGGFSSAINALARGKPSFRMKNYGSLIVSRHFGQSLGGLCKSIGVVFSYIFPRLWQLFLFL
ncbi:hypothetical protein [Burkholderia gladioli]|uniref:hypothetical protein n=1 Tax=Burkholderia gladioli TaxID=28095 RepID=UPI00163E165A|nr:hypothetical protein [Burkholderia gladioli]